MSNLIPKSMKLRVGGYPTASFDVYLDEDHQLIYECDYYGSDGLQTLQSMIEENLLDTPSDCRSVDKEPENKEPSRTLIQPSAADWEEFRNLLDTLKVWGWQKSYEPLAITMDGTHWSVSIEYEDFQIESKGSNAYPNHLLPEIAHGDDSGDWVKFREGVSKLVGGNAFW